MSEIGKNTQGRKPKTSRLSMVKKVAGMICVAFLVFAIIWPAIDKKIRLGRRLTCGQNIFGLGKAMLIYSNGFDGEYPTAEKWCDLLIQNVDVSDEAFECPGNKGARCSYAMNPNCEPNSPPDVVLLFETKGGWNQFGGPEILTLENHKGKRCNILFNDGHVKFVRAEEIGELKWE